jgi:hypothetical protein
MRSLIAALRNLVLPNGATSGLRIVLDADQGVILVYNASDQLIASIAPSDNGNQWLAGVCSYAYDDASGNNHVTQINLGSMIVNTFDAGARNFVAPGGISLDDAGVSYPVALRVTAPTYYTDPVSPGVSHSATMELNSQYQDTDGLIHSPRMMIYDNSHGQQSPVDLVITGYAYAAQPVSWPGVPVAETWHPFNIYGGWVQNSSAETFSYKLDSQGWVRFKGALVASLTSNAGFETGIAPWTVVGGTVTQSTAQVHSGSYSAQIIPDGTSELCYLASELGPVTAGNSYVAICWVWFTNSVNSNFTLSVSWFDANYVYMSTTATVVSVPAGTWSHVVNTVTAPTGAAYGQVAPTLSGTPAAGQVWYVDDVTLEPTSVMDGTLIANIPPPYRPATRQLQLCAHESDAGAARVQILPTGDVSVWDMGSALGVRFDQVAFPMADQQ